MTLYTKDFFFICSYLICNVCICFTFDFEFSLAFGFVCIFITYIVLYFHLYFHLYVFVSGGNNKFFERRKQATANLSLHRLHCVVYKRFTTDNNRLLILFLCCFFTHFLLILCSRIELSRSNCQNCIALFTIDKNCLYLTMDIVPQIVGIYSS